MTKSLNTSSVVSSSKDRKCKKPCQSSSSSSCCTEQCLDCCSSQYQRLSRFAALVADNQVDVQPGSTSWEVAVNLSTGTTSNSLYNRCGTVIPAPSASLLYAVSGGVTGAYANEGGCSGTQANAPISFVNDNPVTIGQVPNNYGTLNARGSTGAGYGDMLIAASGYYYVNEMAYGPYEPGCHNDQVYGWYVNLSTGELQLFTQMDGVPTNATRACLSAEASTLVTSTQKRQLKLLNKLYKLTKSAVKEVNGIPSQEGNIVQVCDCKGEQWLLYVNTASSQNGSPLSTCNYQFAVVATKLC